MALPLGLPLGRFREREQRPRVCLTPPCPLAALDVLLDDEVALHHFQVRGLAVDEVNVASPAEKLASSLVASTSRMPMRTYSPFSKAPFSDLGPLADPIRPTSRASLPSVTARQRMVPRT